MLDRAADSEGRSRRPVNSTIVSNFQALESKAHIKIPKAFSFNLKKKCVLILDFNGEANSAHTNKNNPCGLKKKEPTTKHNNFTSALN